MDLYVSVVFSYVIPVSYSYMYIIVRFQCLSYLFSMLSPRFSHNSLCLPYHAVRPSGCNFGKKHLSSYGQRVHCNSHPGGSDGLAFLLTHVHNMSLVLILVLSYHPDVLASYNKAVALDRPCLFCRMAWEVTPSITLYHDRQVCRRPSPNVQHMTTRGHFCTFG